MNHLTYGQLDEVMRSYGFAVSDPGPDTRVYKHPATGALFMVPIHAPEEPLYTGTTWLRSTPTPSISASMLSPGWR